MYRQQLDRVEQAMKNLETEVEAVRYDLNEVLDVPDGPLERWRLSARLPRPR